ncbi:hypothetical protein HJC23_000729 [Cyclotella cryptica]|uniref:Peroxin-12 n=1 Tax=Cyclotella cryptica TaxID=29204 RepID=A0ABD3QAS3_9STRA|eukprot:CCRYP_007410-RA/>CCRYP_007410-RA protein AED:0.38 eAED:0.38 QI:0/-1/0/1/-1/1/1/0/514
MNVNAATANNLNHNATVPTTIGALLTEENTIDPLSHLPSFLELTFVDVARNSGRVALSAAWDVVVLYFKGTEERLSRLEQMMTRRTASLRARCGTNGRSTGFPSIRRIVHAAMARMRLWYYARLRQTCHAIARGLETLAPEIQTLIMFAIDYHCIHYLTGSTGCEMVYGLKRAKIVNTSSRKLTPTLETETSRNNQQKVVDLTSTDKTKSALLAALLPYWKERCDKLYSRLKDQPSNNQSHDSMHFNQRINPQKIRDIFVKFYPYFHLSHEGSIFLYQFAYLLEYTPYWSFSLHALGVILRRMTAADMQHTDSQKRHQSVTKNSEVSGVSPSATTRRSRRRGIPIDSTSNKSITLPSLFRGALLFSVSYTILSGWYRYFQRELSWRRRRWIAGHDNFSPSQNDGNQGHISRSGGSDVQRRAPHPIPPPPLPPSKLANFDNKHSADQWACPLCHEPRINPTASTSGFVFCYKCLIMRIRRNGESCPVTGMPCKESQVTRLYEPTSSTNIGQRTPG